MKIILFYTEDQYIYILHLTKEEEKEYNIIYNGLEYDWEDCQEFVERLVKKRELPFSDFDPTYTIVTQGCVPVYDEKHKDKDKPLLRLI